MSEKRIALQINVVGRVQNVGYRFAAQKEALRLCLKGFVKNLADGSVYIEVEGSEKELTEFEKWCYSGSLGANVINVNINRQPLCGFNTFEIRR